MITRLIILTLSIQICALTASAQKPTCKSLHTGSFKIFTKESGTTYIKRSEKIQTEKNDDLGYEIIFDIVWIDECTYELRPKKLIKGDPWVMGDGTHVLKVRIKEISNYTYIAHTTASFNPGSFEFVVDILK